jgi:hypothetical protein
MVVSIALETTDVSIIFMQNQILVVMSLGWEHWQSLYTGFIHHDQHKLASDSNILLQVI